MECLCPRCGFVWEHDGLPLTPEFKKAVRLYQNGKYDSVLSALVDQPEHQARLRKVQALCDPTDLLRAKDPRISHPDNLEIGRIYCWAPFNPFAFDVVQVTGFRTTEDGPEIQTFGIRWPDKYWNLKQMVLENLVDSPLKILPMEPL